MPIIHKMAVHHLRLGEDEPKYSEDLIDLGDLQDESDAALDFFKRHIKNNRTQSSTKECRFNLKHSNQIKSTVMELAGNYSEDMNFDDIFFEKSKLFTEFLADSMRGKSKSDGSLFTLLYTFLNEMHIGLLKMDPNLGIEVRDDFTLKVREHILPSPNEILHKTAFIKFKTEFNEEGIHLFVLDRQQNTDEPAKFFMNDFLNATETANNQNLTVIIENEIKKTITQNITSFPDKSKFNERLKYKLTSDQDFNLDQDIPVLIRGLVPDGFAIDESISKIKSEVLKRYPDATFSFPPAKEKVKDLEYRSDDKSVIIKITKDLDKDLYKTFEDPDTKETVFKFSARLNVDVWT